MIIYIRLLFEQIFMEFFLTKLNIRICARNLRKTNNNHFLKQPSSRVEERQMTGTQGQRKKVKRFARQISPTHRSLQPISGFGLSLSSFAPILFIPVSFSYR